MNAFRGNAVDGALHLREPPKQGCGFRLNLIREFRLVEQLQDVFEVAVSVPRRCARTMLGWTVRCRILRRVLGNRHLGCADAASANAPDVEGDVGEPELPDRVVEQLAWHACINTRAEQ